MPSFDAETAMRGTGAGDRPVETQGVPDRAPKRALAPAGVPDDEAARRQRFARQMERGVSGIHFDSARWIAQFPGVTATERARSTQRLLLATEPQQPLLLSSDSLTLVRALAQDAAFQLK